MLSILFDAIKIDLLWSLIIFVSCLLIYRKKLSFKENWSTYLSISFLSFLAYLSGVFIYIAKFYEFKVESETTVILQRLLEFNGTIGLAVFIGFLIMNLQKLSSEVDKAKFKTHLDKYNDRLISEIRIIARETRINNLSELEAIKSDLLVDLDNKCNELIIVSSQTQLNTEEITRNINMNKSINDLSVRIANKRKQRKRRV